MVPSFPHPINHLSISDRKICSDFLSLTVSFSTMSFMVTVIEGDEPFTIDFGSTVEDAFNLIRQSYPDIKGRFRVITNDNEKEIPRDLRPTDLFPADDNNKRVVFIPARQVSPQQGK